MKLNLQQKTKANINKDNINKTNFLKKEYIKINKRIFGFKNKGIYKYCFLIYLIFLLFFLRFLKINGIRNEYNENENINQRFLSSNFNNNIILLKIHIIKKLYIFMNILKINI